ncbi:MAG: hypothetical protein QXI19_10635 [Candidatus Caldarchaeum sp.]
MRQTTLSKFIALSLLALPTSHIQAGDRYVQFRGPSSLAASCIPVGFNGSVGGKGVLAFSTPVGVLLKERKIVFGVGGLSIDEKFRFPRGWERVGKAEDLVNGHGWILTGVRTGNQLLNFGVAFLHGGLPISVNIQGQIPLAGNDWRACVGVQDLNTTGTVRTLGGKTRSYFTAFSYQYGEVYFSGGWGTARFENGFASLSISLAEGFTPMVEYDGKGWNYGTSLQLIPHTFLFIGSRSGRQSALVVGMAF